MRNHVPTDKPVISLVVPKKLLKKIDEFKERYGIFSRNEAVRQLLWKSLDIVEKEDAKNSDSK